MGEMSDSLDRKYFVVLGISGTGKSTRVLQLLRYLESREEPIRPFSYRDKEIGRYIPGLNLLVIGKPTKFKHQTRWQGVDYFISHFSSAESITSFLNDQLKDTHVLIEGASILNSHRYRPRFIVESMGVTDYHIFIYLFPEKDIVPYCNRIFYRSGKYPQNQTTMWLKNKRFINTPAKSRKELPEPLLEEFERRMKTFSYDEPVWHLGERVLRELQPEWVEDFVRWSWGHDLTEEIRYIPEKELF